VPARATSDLSKTQDDRSLSLRERDRVRGNETPPTKTAGPILQAQLDRLPQSVACGAQKQISRRALRTTGVSRQTHWCFERCFPLTPALSPRRGRIFRRACANPERLDSSQRGMRSSLSLRERVRGRGNQTQPTKTTGRILQAQFDRLPEPVACGTQKQISRRALRSTGVSRQAHWCFERCFPLTQALPWGEGECFADLAGLIVILSSILRNHQ
jgi:hypothetical protein